MTAKKATRKSWKTLPLPERRTRLTLERRFDADEWRRIRRGHVPEEMEDKWFVFEERGRLCFHRSWTGFCVYDVHLRKIPSGVEIVEVWANRDSAQYTETNDVRDALILAYLIDELLLGRRGVWPESGLGQEALRQWSSVGRAMLAHDEDGKAAKELDGEISAARDAPRGGDE